MIKTVFLLLLLLIYRISYCQEKLERLSAQDSVTLLKYWDELLPFLTKKNATIPKFVNDSINCTLCIKEGQSSAEWHMTREMFVEKGINAFRMHAKILKTITEEKPAVGIFYFDDPVWVIGFDYWKPNELATGHEGASILFEFKKTKDKLILFQISTIP